MKYEDESDEERHHRLKMEAMQAEHRAAQRLRSVEKGLLLVHTGDGKGKSTAAFGLALRAAGHGQRVAVVQFTKGSWKTGEGKALARFPEIEHHVVGDGFTWDTQDRRADIARASAGFDLVEELIERCRGDAPAFDLLVLDELNIVVDYAYLPVDRVVRALASRPPALHVCATGRGARPELLAIADTVTEMRLVKHAYDAGVKAQAGIEY